MGLQGGAGDRGRWKSQDPQGIVSIKAGQDGTAATLLQLVKTHVQDFKWPDSSVKHYFHFKKAQWKQKKKKKMWPRGKENESRIIEDQPRGREVWAYV